MGVESATKISQLNPAWPLGSDPKSEGDNHLRLIKDVLQKDAAAISKANTFGASQTIEAAAPYLSFSETDVAANIGKWSMGLTGGTLVIQPRDSTGSTISSGGGLAMYRNATGLSYHQFTSQVAGGSVKLCEFDGGSAEFVRPTYGFQRISMAGTGFLSGGNGAANLGNFFAGQNSADTTVFRVIAPTGNVQNTNNSYGAISDLRLKSNIEPVGDQLVDLLQLQVVHFTLIEDPEQLRQIGLIAQDVQRIKPGLIEEDPETGMLGIKYSVFTPILIKAAQQLAIENGQMRDQLAELLARVEALEGLA